MEDDPDLAAIRARKLAALLAERGDASAGGDEESDDNAHRAAAEEGGGSPDVEALDHPVDVADAEFGAFVARHPRVVVDFWAPWCGPCRIVGPVVDALAREMRGRVAFAKVNVDECPRTAQAHAVQSIPTLVMIHHGRLVDRIVGAVGKPQLSTAIRRAFRTGSPSPPRRV